MSNIQIISLLVVIWAVVTILAIIATTIYYWVKTGSFCEAIKEIFF